METRSDAERDTVRVALGARSYHVVVGADAVGGVTGALLGHDVRRCAVITQAPIREHADAVADAVDRAFIPTKVIEMADGEVAKSLTTIDELCRAMSDFGLLRGDAVVAVGGGVVGDTAGFAASAYYRGIAVVQVPTTLLAMVDSAIGGKTAVNLPQGKNLVGAFHQPIGVFADPGVLATLPDREYRCGLGELAKYALMGDEALQGILQSQSAALSARDPEVLRTTITRSRRRQGART